VSDPEGARPEPRLRLAGPAAGPLLFVIMLAWPWPGLGREAHLLAAVFAWVVVYWLTEALPLAVTALLSSVLCVGLGIAPARVVLAPYADPVIFLFIGSFVLAQAMRQSGLDRRFAFAILARRWATRTPGRVLASVGVGTCAISLWVSNTATTAMMLPVGTGLLTGMGRLGDPRQSRFPIALLLMLTWASSVAVGIPIGSPPNLIAIGLVRDLTTRRLTFFDWTAVTMPVTIVMLALAWLILWRRYGVMAEPPSDVERYVEEERARLGPWSRAQVNVTVVFTLACVFWTLPGLLAMVSGPEAPWPVFLERHAPESVVALSAAIRVIALPTELKRGSVTLTWRQAVAIDWGTILLFGGGLSLGRLVFETRLAEAIGRGLVDVSGVEGVWGLTAGAVVLGVILSEASSNTASASMLIPVMTAVAESGGVSPIPPVLGAALGASFGFMLPVSTPPNAIVYGSGLVPLREMVRAGILLDLAGIIVIWTSLRILCPLLGVM
jgi:sodium-dependent dicarboxylate transporter 2/3/5